jgi:hypothetical protein
MEIERTKIIKSGALCFICKRERQRNYSIARYKRLCLNQSKLSIQNVSGVVEKKESF